VNEPSNLPELSVVIPVFRSEAVLAELHERLCRELEGWGKSFEIVFVEDCGGDGSWSVIERLEREDPRVRGLKLIRNFGQHNALLCGIRQARGAVILTLDDDLQHPPEVLRPLFDKLDEGFDVVYGPPLSEQHGFFRNLASTLTKLVLQRAMGTANARSVSALRVFRTRIREAFADYRSPIVNIDVLLTWGTRKFTAVRVEHRERKVGRSGYTPWRLFNHAFNMITGFSTLPLQIASAVGVLFALFGAGVLFQVIWNWIRIGSVVPGFAFLASLISIFSGAQLLALGVIGEYLSRMHLRSLGRPAYVVEERDALEP
jgi:glycosyltransferase involved in cell wall biosynthesis